MFNSIGEDGAERCGLAGYDLGRTGDTGVVNRDRTLHFRVPSLVAVDFLVALAVGVHDGGVVRAHAILEIGLAVDHHHVTLIVSNEALGQYAAAELSVHGLLDLVARTALVPDADFVVNGVLSVGFARPEIERSEATDSAKCRTAVDRTGALAVNIDIEATLVDHHGDVVPATYLQSTVSVYALFAHCIPTGSELTVFVGVEHELSPATGLQVPVFEALGLHPELNGAVAVRVVEDIGDVEAVVVELGGDIGCLHGDGRADSEALALHTAVKQSRNAVSAGAIDGLLTLFGVGNLHTILIDVVSLDIVTTGLRSIPSELCALQLQVAGHGVLFAVNDAAHRGDLTAGHVEHAVFGIEFERSFYTFLVEFVIDDRHIIDVSATLGARSYLRLGAGVYVEEEFEGFRVVETFAEVSQVVTELHGFVMQLAVCPTTEHRNCGRRVHIAVVAVACPAEVVQIDGLFGTRGVGVGGHTHSEEHFRTVGVVHLHLDGAQRTIVLAHIVKFGLPPAATLLAHFFAALFRDAVCGEAVSVGAVDQTVVGPSAPGVGDDPSTDFVFFFFTGLTVAVEVKFDAIVVTYHREGVVDARTPPANVALSHHTGCYVGIRAGNTALRCCRGHTDTGDTAASEVSVAVVVPQPVLQHVAALFCADTHRQVTRGQHAVEHGFVPLLVTRHPTIVLAVPLFVTEEGRVTATAVGFHRRHTYVLYKLILARVAVSEEPHEVRGIHIFGQRSVGMAEGVQLVSEHIGNARCRTARTTFLRNDGREVHRRCVVHVVGALALSRNRCAFQTSARTVAHERTVGAHGGIVVGIFLTIHYELCRKRRREGDGSQTDEFENAFHIGNMSVMGLMSRGFRRGGGQPVGTQTATTGGVCSKNVKEGETIQHKSTLLRLQIYTLVGKTTRKCGAFPHRDYDFNNHALQMRL